MSKGSGTTKSSSFRNKANSSSTTKSVLGLTQPKYGMPKGTVEYSQESFDSVAFELQGFRDYIKENKTGGSLNLTGNDYVIFHMKGDKSSDGKPYYITLQEGDDMLPKGLRASKIIAIDHWMSGSEGGSNNLSTHNAKIVTDRYRQSKSRKTTIYKRKK